MTMTEQEITISKIALGVAIRRLRHDRVLTIASLADKAGVSAGHLRKIERGDGNPRWDLLGAIASGLDTSLSTLLRSAAIEEGVVRFMRRSERRLTPEEFEQHFGDLPTDGEG
jgi:transcriptional regulator with XRE-family HTH domain